MSNSTDFYNNLNNFSGYMNALSFGGPNDGGNPGYANNFSSAASGYQNAISGLNPSATTGASQQNYMQGAQGLNRTANSLNKTANSITNPNGAYGTDTQNARSYINGITPGYSADEQSKIRYGAEAPIAGAYGDAATQMRDTAARTGNQAGVGANLADFARNKGKDMSAAVAQTEGSIADARRQDTLAKANLMPIPGQMSLQGSQAAGNLQSAAGGMYGNLSSGGTSQYGANTQATSLGQGPMNSYLSALGLTTGNTANTLGMRSANAYKGSVTSGIGNVTSLMGAI